ncbi:MAG: glutamine-hydrolyzing carbamoyl-phosphate synthase small subunit [Cytophagales bacterium]|nr:glutamine-hydrolyzing carbamoyl-phosphate synthase small subunit [Cytophagales bacterium]
MKRGILLLEDGTQYRGISLGAEGEAMGEICFTTGMAGYQEAYTDPSYFGQIVVNTFPHIGNYGFLSHREEESEEPKIRSLVVSSPSPIFTRQNAKYSLNDYLKKHNIVGISGIDTRHLVTHIRSQGSMNAIVSSYEKTSKDLLKHVLSCPSMEGLSLVQKVGTPKPYTIPGKGRYRLAIIDLGIKKSLIKEWSSRGLDLHIFPFQTPFVEMEKCLPHGYFISNGPGDPAAIPDCVKTVQDIIKAEKPLFGVCLGHQILGRACGISTYKLKFGHRGINHPIKDLRTGKSEITSQNHGFCLNKKEVENSNQVQLTHVHLNDDTVAGIQLKAKPAFSVQYHPEASPGPHDSSHLFEEFLSLLIKYEKQELCS